MNNNRIITLPKSCKFKSHEYYDFNSLLQLFDWKIRNEYLSIDFSQCFEANYQALSLFVLYIWHLRINNCFVKCHFNDIYDRQGASKMWVKMGAQGLFNIQDDSNENFRGSYDKPLFAVRNNRDFSNALEKAESYTENFDIEYEKTLRYIIAELLYNTLEHGRNSRGIPSLIQFTWYQRKGEISFIVADLGIGIKRHIRQAYPDIEDDISAIKHALKPQVSGTFLRSTPYAAKDNAGVGLYLSSNIIRKLRADMHIVSGNGVVHISPTDITDRKINSYWPGTLIYVTIKLGVSEDISLGKMMSEFRVAAASELSQGEEKDNKKQFYLNVRNYFGRYAEEKTRAIDIRDTKIIPAVDDNQILLIDFEDVVSAPHSFLSALLAVPIRRYGMSAYKMIKIINAEPEIRETIDYILNENT